MLLSRLRAIAIAHGVAVATAVVVATIGVMTGSDTGGGARPDTGGVLGIILLFGMFVTVGFLIAVVATLPATMLGSALAFWLLRANVPRGVFVTATALAGLVIGVPLMQLTMMLRGPVEWRYLWPAPLSDVSPDVLAGAVAGGAAFGVVLWRYRALFRSAVMSAPGDREAG